MQLRSRDLQPVTLLLVEDDPAHAELIESNLRKGGIGNEVIHLLDGEQTLDFLFGRKGYENTRRPESLVILLDLNLPKVDGFEVLKTVKADPALKVIPVIVLTSSEDPEEIQRCYGLGCNLFIPKPVEFENFASVMRELGLLMIAAVVPKGDREPKQGEQA
jgi:CheY-like chemotaxis protein